MQKNDIMTLALLGIGIYAVYRFSKPLEKTFSGVGEATEGLGYAVGSAGNLAGDVLTRTREAINNPLSSDVSSDWNFLREVTIKTNPLLNILQRLKIIG